MAKGTFVEKVEVTTIPDGKYDGLWGGYIVTVIGDDGTTYRIHTDMGVRGNNIPVFVTVHDGKIVVEQLV